MSDVGLISCEHLCLSYGQAEVLRGVTLSVGAGELVALMGPSGSGKTSLLHCLAGLVSSDSGEIVFDGASIRDAGPERLAALRRRDFGFVFQRADLIPELTLRENVALPLELQGESSARSRRAAENILGHLGLAEQVAARPGHVSGGQQQRAAVARALVHSPRVLFADEPTGNLDTENGAVVLGSMLRLSREQGTAVVLVTHDPGIAAQADRVVHLRDGVVGGPA